ncbi:MAG: hypothetical protein M1550_04380 [Deltaproteobacteria bacterium]|nr:hypothetical protein [Deltaproteobacteria bacterium]
MSGDSLSAVEAKLLSCLLDFYREFGPGAAPAIRGLDEESGLGVHEIDEAIRSLRGEGLIEYWALQPVVRLSEAGLRLALRLSAESGG